jgi:ubiquinone/menaquinone biosynthesis C-methylase UbiE
MTTKIEQPADTSRARRPVAPRRRLRLFPRRQADWDARVDHVEALSRTAPFRGLRDQLLALAALDADDHLLDVGSGTGLLALAAAPHVAHATAVDVSERMCARLRERLRGSSIVNVDVMVSPAGELPLADASVDVVVSSYCFHNMTHEGKLEALRETARVLRPGGRIVIGDMMFSMSVADPRGRAVIVGVVRRLARKGLPGLVRVVRNAVRMLAGRGEHPAGVEWWRQALDAVGFTGIVVRALDHEGGIAIARLPA